MEYIEFTAKSVQDAITEACTHFIVTSASLDYVVVEEGSSGFLGIGSKPAVIKARVKEEEDETVTKEDKPVKETVKEEKKPEEKVEKTEVKENKAPSKKEAVPQKKKSPESVEGINAIPS